MPDALRDEITFFGHIIQGNRITIKTDDMKVLNPDEDEIFEITVRRIVPPKGLPKTDLSAFAKSLVEVLKGEGVFDDPEFMLLLLLRKHDMMPGAFKKEELTEGMIVDMCRATLALTGDKKLSDILRMKLERLKE